MKVILHVGAHRTGTATLQDYMRTNAGALAEMGVGFWGPERRRAGLFARLDQKPGWRGLCRDPRRRAEGRIRLHLAEAERRGIRTLVISDAAMLGSLRSNFRARSLYPAAGERMARLARAFDGRLSTILLCVRSLELYWASAAGRVVMQGMAPPSAFRLRQIAARRRGWRDVVTDLACAAPGVRILVMPFERVAGRPQALLQHATGLDMPGEGSDIWLNRAPTAAELGEVSGGSALRDAGLVEAGDGRVTVPASLRSDLRRRYAEDMSWLRSGAEGLAVLTEDLARSDAGTDTPPRADVKGQDDEPEKGYLARSG
ncbi:hypothetical protein R5H30_16345 [Sulfitobacter sp. D35]|uniref:hypothetical protein n=1 Tax=Sulfitobacter sp. D35 TaxID=3083252 RepID=UPI00296E7534|nr:hypothetical protein [Sulfitobacter sp. D35]MDW4499565.1 hypothetical protein [Sulfitobacter sp. D35]